MRNYSYMGIECNICNGTIYYKTNNLCVKCNPTNPGKQEDVKVLQKRRRKIEEHQHRYDYIDDVSIYDEEV